MELATLRCIALQSSFWTRAGSDEKGLGMLEMKGHDHTFFFRLYCTKICDGLSRNLQISPS